MSTSSSKIVPIEEFIIYQPPLDSENADANPNSTLFKGMNFVFSSHLRSIPQLKSANLDFTEPVESMGGTVFRTLNTALNELASAKESNTLYLIMDFDHIVADPPKKLKGQINILKVEYNWLMKCVLEGKIVEPIIIS